jgi:transketolase
MDMKATREGLGNALKKLAETNKEVVALAAGVGDSTQSLNMKKLHPERYIEAGIAEQNMVTMAAGLALAGKIPFASSFASFLPGRCFDQIRQSVCYANLNVKLVSTHAGLTVGPDGATHQMMEDIAMMRALPNMTVVVPCDALEAERAVLHAAEMRGPIYIRLGREKMPVLTQDKKFELGKGMLMRQGKDLTIIATGIMVNEAMVAAEELEKDGISARVINIHTIKPIDEEMILQAAKETKHIVTAEEHQVYGGLGGAVAELLSKKLPTKMSIVGMKDTFGESGSAKDLMKKYGLDSATIVSASKELLQQN